jgi:general secretion pathway protein B
MSVILDALKKIEEERKPRRTASIHLASDILRPEHARPRKRFVLLSIAASATVVSSLTFAVMTWHNMQKESVPSTQAIAPPSIERTQDARTGKGGTVPVSEAARSAGKAKGGAAPVHRASAPINATPLLPEKAKKTGPAASARPDLLEDLSNPSESARQEPVPVPASLRISCIIWFEEPRERRAVVNGITIGEGATIEGARVEQIYPTRVRFSRNGKSFEVPCL